MKLKLLCLVIIFNFSVYATSNEILNESQIHKNLRCLVCQGQSIADSNSDFAQTLTYEASIQTNFIRDYYLTMSNIDRSDYYNIKFQKKPLMIWIWISVAMLSLGGFLSLFRHAKNN